MSIVAINNKIVGSVVLSFERNSDLRTGMAEERVLENVIRVFHSVQHHLVEIDGSVGVEIGAGYSQWTGKGEVLVEEHFLV